MKVKASVLTGGYSRLWPCCDAVVQAARQDQAPKQTLDYGHASPGRSEHIRINKSRRVPE